MPFQPGPGPTGLPYVVLDYIDQFAVITAEQMELLINAFHQNIKTRYNDNVKFINVFDQWKKAYASEMSSWVRFMWQHQMIKYVVVPQPYPANLTDKNDWFNTSSVIYTIIKAELYNNLIQMSNDIAQQLTCKPECKDICYYHCQTGCYFTCSNECTDTRCYTGCYGNVSINAKAFDCLSCTGTCYGPYSCTSDCHNSCRTDTCTIACYTSCYFLSSSPSKGGCHYSCSGGFYYAGAIHVYQRLYDFGPPNINEAYMPSWTPLVDVYHRFSNSATGEVEYGLMAGNPGTAMSTGEWCVHVAGFVSGVFRDLTTNVTLNAIKNDSILFDMTNFNNVTNYNDSIIDRQSNPLLRDPEYFRVLRLMGWPSDRPANSGYWIDGWHWKKNGWW